MDFKEKEIIAKRIYQLRRVDRQTWQTIATTVYDEHPDFVRKICGQDLIPRDPLSLQSIGRCLCEFAGLYLGDKQLADC